MGRKINSGLSSGVKGQTTIENYELIDFLTSQKDYENLSITREPDFYVGPNGKVLSAQYKKWIGKSRRDKLLKNVKNKSLKNAISQLYRPGSFIGDGDTASIVLFERRTGIGLGNNGGTHEKKAVEMIAHIRNKILGQDLSKLELKIAKNLIKKLERALLR